MAGKQGDDSLDPIADKDFGKLFADTRPAPRPSLQRTQ